MCLLAVGEDQIWAGSFDTKIYVVDMASKTSNQTLNMHTDMVTDLTLADDLKLVMFLLHRNQSYLAFATFPRIE